MVSFKLLLKKYFCCNRALPGAYHAPLAAAAYHAPIAAPVYHAPLAAAAYHAAPYPYQASAIYH